MVLHTAATAIPVVRRFIHISTVFRQLMVNLIIQPDSLIYEENAFANISFITLLNRDHLLCTNNDKQNSYSIDWHNYC